MSIRSRRSLGYLGACMSLGLVLAVAPRASAQTNGSDAVATSSGVYTAEQAARGQAVFQRTCSLCHSVQEFTGVAFTRGWVGMAIGDRFEFIKMNMPMDNPGSLRDQEYADVITYFLQQNGYPAGATELPADYDELLLYKIDPVPSAEGR